ATYEADADAPAGLVSLIAKVTESEVSIKAPAELRNDTSMVNAVEGSAAGAMKKLKAPATLVAATAVPATTSCLIAAELLVVDPPPGGDELHAWLASTATPMPSAN